MSIEFEKSQTKDNLMRAFAGESQARNRYTFSASQAKKSKLHVVEAVFKFTANQEKEHAEIFYNYLKSMAGKSIHVDGGYPVDITDSIVQLLRYAQHNEYEEHDDVYKHFGDVAKEEGFESVAYSFYNIARVEKTHGDRFGMFADLIEQEKLFISDIECNWMCLNCGYIYKGEKVPEMCPVCNHDKGFFIRLEIAPFTYEKKI